MKLFSCLIVILLLSAGPSVLFSEIPQGKQAKRTDEMSLARLDINRASAEDFAKLPGVGSELARRIVDFRAKHGPFRRVEDLLAIRGIGPKKWRKLRPYLRVGEK